MQSSYNVTALVLNNNASQGSGVKAKKLVGGWSLYHGHFPKVSSENSNSFKNINAHFKDVFGLSMTSNRLGMFCSNH